MNSLSKTEPTLRYAPNLLYLASSNKRAEAIVVGLIAEMSRKYRVRKVEVVEKRTFKSDIKKIFLALTGGPICGTKVMCSVEPWAVDNILEEDDAPEIVPHSEDGYFVWKN